MPTAQVQGLSLTNTISTEVGLTWTALTGDEPTGGSAITDYEYSINSGSNWTSLGTTTSSETVTLSDGAFYTFLMRAVNTYGNGSQSTDTIQLKLPPIITGLTAPGDVSDAVAGQNYAGDFTWSTSTSNHYAATGYRVQVITTTDNTPTGGGWGGDEFYTELWNVERPASSTAGGLVTITLGVRVYYNGGFTESSTVDWTITTTTTP